MKLKIFEGHYTEAADLEEQVNAWGDLHVIEESNVTTHGNTLMIFVWYTAHNIFEAFREQSMIDEEQKGV